MASGKSAGSIFVDLLLNDSKYEEGFRRSSNSTKRWAGQTNAQFKGVITSTDAIGTAIGRLGSIAAGALSIQKIVAYSDSFKGLESRLSLVTDSSQDLADTTQKLFDIAQNNRQPFEDTIDAYTRLNNSLNDNQKASTDLIKFTDLLSKTLLISGTNAAGAATFFQQFGQAASSDFKAIGQELQTFADQNPRFYGILRDEAAKYGKTLKQMAQDGELSFEFVSEAVLKAGDSIEGEAGRIGNTLGKAFTELNNSVLIFIGRSEAVSAATSGVADAISGLAVFISDLSKDADILGTTLYGLTAQMIDFYKKYQEVSKTVAENTNFFGLRDEDVAEYEKNIQKANAALDRLAAELQARKDLLADAAASDSADEPGRPRTPRPGVAAGPTEEELKLQRELQSLYDKNEGLITGLDDATLRYNHTLEDLNELLKNGKINQEEYNGAVGRASEELEKAREKANVWAFDVEAASKRAAENIQDSLADFLFDPFDKGLDGMLLGFVNTLRKMAAEAAAAKLLESIFGGSTGGGGGFLGNIFGSIFGGATGGSGVGKSTVIGSSATPGGPGIKLFAEGGYIGPGEYGIAGEAGAELLYGGKQGITVIPQDKMGMGGNNYYIDATGADRGAVTRLEAALIQLAGPGKIEQRVLNAQKRGQV